MKYKILKWMGCTIECEGLTINATHVKCLHEGLTIDQHLDGEEMALIV